jgi:hypothetical protein
MLALVIGAVAFVVGPVGYVTLCDEYMFAVVIL